jgi:hypothetical protein
MNKLNDNVQNNYSPNGSQIFKDSFKLTVVLKTRKQQFNHHEEHKIAKN